MDNYIAFDLGAGSGRAITGSLDDNGILNIKELRRFPNRMVNEKGNLCWDVFGLYREITQALQSYSDKSYGLASIGVDTWGVDFGLLDKDGNLLGKPFTYRNPATTSGMEDFLKKIPRDKLYYLTGIQLLPINSVFQLYSLVRHNNPLITNAKDLLFIPDLFNYFLTGNKLTEFTIATTSQLYNPLSHSWEREIIDNAGISESLMQCIVQPGTVIGTTSSEVAELSGLKNIPVVAVASHDTGSAIASIPAPDDDFAFISCGTWSLMGIVSPEPVINERTLEYNISNEGGIYNTFRVLKNIAGLWLLEQCRREWSKIKDYSYDELVNIARTSGGCDAIIDQDSKDFFNPPDMLNAIASFCRNTGQNIPLDAGQYVNVILRSLALAHRYTLDQLKDACRKNIKRIHIIGGGSQNQLLCQFTADATGLPVYAGPVEATAIGNILVQLMAAGRLSSLHQARELVRNSFGTQVYEPECAGEWELFYQRFLKLKL